MYHIKSVIKNVLCWMGYHTLIMKLVSVTHDSYGMSAQCGWCGFKGSVDDHGNLS